MFACLISLAERYWRTL